MPRARDTDETDDMNGTDDRSTMTDDDTAMMDDDTPEPDDQPEFGVVAALVAFLAAGPLATRRMP